MTLVQVLANETSVHMACDFRLTDIRTMKAKQNDAHKLVGVGAGRSALIGVTGVAELDGKPIGNWISEVISSQGVRPSLQDVLDALLQAETPLAHVRDDRFRRHTFVVGAIIGTQSIVALVSNFEKIVNGRVDRSPTADLGLTVSRIRPKAEMVLVTGAADAVSTEDREKLRLALRSGMSDEQIQELLSRINASASSTPLAAGMVSAGCHVASIHATGTGSGQSFLTDEQQGDFIPPEVADMLRQAGLRLKPAIGPDGKPKPIQVRSVSSISISPSRKYFREQFKLQPDNAELWNNYGAFLASKRDFDGAMEAFQRAMSLDPRSSAAIANLAKKTWQHRGDTAEADRLYAEAIRVSAPGTPAWILSDYAVLCDEGLSDAKHAAELHEAATNDNRDVLASARKAHFAYRQAGDRDLADSLLQHALDAQPNNIDVLIISGQVDWFHKGERETARDKLQKACTLDPRNHSALRLAGDFSLVLGDPSSAGYYYRRLMNLGGYSAEVGGNYGLALLMDRKFQGAVRQLAKAHDLDPTNPNITVNLTAALWAHGRRNEATTQLHQILKLSLPPEIELEALAMSHLMCQPSTIEIPARIRALIDEGIRADGNTIRSMAYGRPRAERDTVSRLADIIEGKASIPSGT